MSVEYPGRIDSHHTHTHGEYRLRTGKPYPFGAIIVPGGVNFAIFSRHAVACTLVLFKKGELEPMAEIPFPREFIVGNVFTMTVYGLDIEDLDFEYGFRLTGPYAPHRGHWFDPDKILLDPYARAVGGRDLWGELPDHTDVYPHRAQLIFEDYDWEGDRPLEIAIEDLVIYEMHVRGFTKHLSSGVKYPGTFTAIREKIPYLKALGINCVELMPIFEFDEFEYDRVNPMTGEHLLNYWGYSTVGFFAPKSGYAATGRFAMQCDEFKTLVKDLHRNGIEVILDVVFNHTAEGNEKGSTISFRGIDNKTYYMLAPDGNYLNFSGTGNTMNCNNPVVRNMVLDCLRYWVSEYHIDGFRFDLASILGRNEFGIPLANPPLLEMMAYDPILAKTKLIAEAWDAGGLYQVGSFPAYGGRWAEWNGKYRDTLRRFLKGDPGIAWETAERLQGSPDLYQSRGTGASINFITCHDGFSLMDLFSYNEKHNYANGEDNRDGANDNYSWNCGAEGLTDYPAVNKMRRQMMKNAVALLMVSQGVPMILMGDELGHTKMGNNNTYCQDNDLNWLNWELEKQHSDIFRFFQQMIAFRHAHPTLRNHHHFIHRDYKGSGYPDISWHSTQAWRTDWGDYVRTLAFMLCGKHAHNGEMNDDYLYVAANMHWDPHEFELPGLPRNMTWMLFADTSERSPRDICQPGQEVQLATQKRYMVNARSVVILVGKPR
ncbi:MAG: glycogen debranching protein GlgX [Anaerolineae bacterium]|nr:glycogen debranching protein GlgX [Anaerolineae bacterium]